MFLSIIVGSLPCCLWLPMASSYICTMYESSPVHQFFPYLLESLSTADHILVSWRRRNQCPEIRDPTRRRQQHHPGHRQRIVPAEMHMGACLHPLNCKDTVDGDSQIINSHQASKSCSFPMRFSMYIYLSADRDGLQALIRERAQLWTFAPPS